MLCVRVGLGFFGRLNSRGGGFGTRLFSCLFFSLLFFLSWEKEGRRSKGEVQCRVIKQNKEDTGQMSLIGIRVTSKSSGRAVQGIRVLRVSK